MSLSTPSDYLKWRWTTAKEKGRNWTDDQVLQSMLEDKDFCDIRRRRCLPRGRHTRNLIPTFIWEFCGFNTKQLSLLWKNAESLDLLNKFSLSGQGIMVLEPLWTRSIRNGYNYFDHGCDAWRDNPSLVLFGHELYQTYRDYLSLFSKQGLLDSGLLSCPYDWSRVAFLREAGLDFGPWRFEEELDIFMGEAYEKKMSELVQRGWDALKLGVPLDLSFLQSPAQVQDIGDNSLIFAVAGSGKTQRIFDCLYTRFGYYLTSGRLGEQSTTIQAGPTPAGQPARPVPILKPRRGGASRDTALLHICRFPVEPYGDSVGEDLRILSRRLAINREATLRCFLRREPSLDAARWLLFQLACSGDHSRFDPFVPTLELFLLTSAQFASEVHEFAVPPIPIMNWPLLVFIDEAQCELNPNIGGLTDLAYIIHGTQIRQNGGQRRALSGTSLRLSECDDVLRYHAASNPIVSLGRGDHEVLRVTDFPLVTTEEKFESLFRSHVRRVISCINYISQLESKHVDEFGLVEVFLPNVSGMDKQEFFDCGRQFLNNIQCQSPGSNTRVDAAAVIMNDYFMASTRKECVIEHSLLLRGRVRWSILYIEHLLAHYLQQTKQVAESSDKEDNPKWIEEQSLICQNIIKHSLQGRLRELALSSKAEHIYMLEDLYWTAIRAELMHKPCILRDERSGQLITEGFAVLNKMDGKPGVQQKLAEPLAITAVIEHLRNCGDGHKDILKRLLFDSQDDPSSFGKAAEYYLAWSIAGLLSVQPGVPHLAPEARAAFLEILGKATFISTGMQGERIDMTEHNLHIPERHGNNRFDKSMDFHEWLRRVREGEYYPPLYFPSKYAGPDVVFIMKSNNRANFIPCAIQLKTAKCCSKDDVVGVLRTIEPNLWFSEAKNMKARFEEEVEMWKQPGQPKRLQFLTLLFTTSASCKDYFKFEYQDSELNVLEEVLSEIAKERKELANEKQGMETVAKVHQRLTGNPWRERSKSTQGQSAQGKPGYGEPARDRPSPSREDATSSETRPYPRRDFYFAVLDRRHTKYFFGKDVEMLISAIKSWKGEEVEDEDELLNEPDEEAKRALRGHPVKVLKAFCNRGCGIKGASRMKKDEVVNRLARVPNVLDRFAGFSDSDGDINIPDPE